MFDFEAIPTGNRGAPKAYTGKRSRPQRFWNVDGRRRVMASSRSQGTPMSKLRFSIEQGARIFRRLELSCASVEAFLDAVHRGLGREAACRALEWDEAHLSEVIGQAERCLERRLGRRRRPERSTSPREGVESGTIIAPMEPRDKSKKGSISRGPRRRLVRTPG